MDKVQIIYSKLIPPVPQTTYMRLPNLNRKMNHAKNYPLAIVQSGPGYGKSLSIAQFLKDNRIFFSWYTVTSEDDNVIPFITYLIKSIERVVPTFGSSLKDVKIRSNLLKDDKLERWLASFINELLELPHRMTIVIDDFHEVAHEFYINKLMERVVESLPPHVNVIVSTRIRPKWSNLLKMKMKDRLFDITERDFLFTKEETAYYLEEFYRIYLSEKEIVEIYQFTEGWAIAINLIAYQLKEGELSLSSKNPILQNLFNYLSEEVFQRRTETERQWLMKFSIFPTFSKALIEQFYGRDAVKILENLVQEHGFIQALDGEGTYRYHSLFYRFLKNKWLETNEALYIALHKKASEYFSANNNYIEATYHANQTEDSAFIGDVLMKTASPLIRSGQFDWFLQIYDTLEEKIINDRYLLYYYAGEVHRYRAFYEQARRAYVTCMKLAKRTKNAYLLSRSYAGIAHIYLDTIQPGMAEKYLKKAIEWSQKTEDMKEEEKLLLKRQFAENLVNLGRATDAKLWTKKEKIPEKVLRKGNLDARIYLRMGKLKDSEKILLEETTRTNVPESHRETQVLLSLIHSLTGDIDLALENAKDGIKVGEVLNSGFIRAVGYTRLGHAEMLHNPYHLEQAETYYHQAIEMMKQLKVPRGLVEPTMGLSVLLARKGKFREAIEQSKVAVRETEKVNDQWMLALVFTSISIIYFYKGDFENAEKNIERARYLFELGGDSYGMMVCHFWRAMIFYRSEKITEAALHFRSFLHILNSENYHFFLVKETFLGLFDAELIYPLIKAVVKEDPSLRNIKIVKDYVTKAENHLGYHLYISVFDHFAVHLSSDLSEELTWKREKAKEMLIYFILNQNRLLSKEEIILALWPDSNRKDDSNFKVTLNYLLKVIEPNRKARQPSFFIERQQMMYRINKNAKIVVDMHLFEKFIEESFATDDPSEALVHLLRANKIFKGPPFEEYRHIDWIAPKREALENKFVRMHEKIAQHYAALGEYDKTISWSEKLIDLDKTWEEAYRLLMISYFKLQNRPQSIKWYEKCKLALWEELNIEPMESTNRLYDMIINEELLL